MQRERGRAARHARDEEPRARQRQRQEAVAAEGHRAARASARSATRCGGTAAPCSGRSRAATITRCRRRSSAARCARRSPQKLQDGALVVVDELTAAEIKTKAAVELLEAARRHRQGGAGGRRGRREAVAVGAQHSRRVAGGERAADGAAMIATPSGSWRPRARSRSCRRRSVMKLTDVIRRPLITEKTSILREDGRTIVFQVAPGANKIQIRRAVEQLLGSKVASIRTSHRARQGQAAGPLRRPPAGLEEGLREAARGRRRCPNSWRRVITDQQVHDHAIRKYNPTSPGQRFQTVQTFDEITTHGAAQAAGRAAAPDRAAATTAAS